MWSDYRVLDLTYEMEACAAVPRAKAGELPPEARARSFLEVEQALSEEAARQEARRCLRCDLERRMANERDPLTINGKEAEGPAGRYDPRRVRARRIALPTLCHLKERA